MSKKINEDFYKEFFEKRNPQEKKHEKDLLIKLIDESKILNLDCFHKNQELVLNSESQIKNFLIFKKAIKDTFKLDLKTYEKNIFEGSNEDKFLLENIKYDNLNNNYYSKKTINSILFNKEHKFDKLPTKELIDKDKRKDIEIVTSQIYKNTNIINETQDLSEERNYKSNDISIDSSFDFISSNDKYNNKALKFTKNSEKNIKNEEVSQDDFSDRSNSNFKTIKNKTTNARQKYNLGCLKHYELECSSYFNYPFKNFISKNKKLKESKTKLNEKIECFLYLLKYKKEEFSYFKKDDDANNVNNNSLLTVTKENLISEKKIKDIENLDFPNFHPIGVIFSKFIGTDIPIELTNSEFWNEYEFIIQEKIDFVFYDKVLISKENLKLLFDFNLHFFNDFSLEKK